MVTGRWLTRGFGDGSWRVDGIFLVAPAGAIIVSVVDFWKVPLFRSNLMVMLFMKIRWADCKWRLRRGTDAGA